MKAPGLYLVLIFFRADAVPVQEPGSSSEPESRFLSPLTLEGIGRIFKLQSEINSCYRCSVDYPQHASACCLQGYANCCQISNPTYPINGYSSGSSYGYSAGYGGLSLVKDGLCPLVSPVSSISLQSCSSQCDSDGQCVGDFKCCLYGCSRLCTQPQLTSLGSSVGYEKSGFCPANSGAMIFPSDSDVVVSAGSYSSTYNRYAPWNYANGDDSYRLQYCGGDSDCPASYKCCLRHYQRTCTLPTYSYDDFSYGRK